MPCGGSTGTTAVGSGGELGAAVGFAVGGVDGAEDCALLGCADALAELEGRAEADADGAADADGDGAADTAAVGLGAGGVTGS